MPTALLGGEVVWVDFGEPAGREQGGLRPAVVVAGSAYLAIVDTLAMVVPLTTVDRGWPNHVIIAPGPLARTSWALTEQLRTISRTRIARSVGHCTVAELDQIRGWISDFLDLA